MKKVRKNIVIILVVIGLMNTLCASVFAAEAGSITVHTKEAQNKSQPIAGVQVTLYYIAQLANDNSTHYINTSEFASFSGKLTWNSASDCEELASQLYDYVKNQGVKGETKVTDKDGQALFGNLNKGLYLVVQSGKESEKYKTFIPALIEVPLYDSNQYEYNINLYPKMDSKPTSTPTIPIPDPDTPGGGDLPSTGMLQWPIPIMAVAGCVCIIVGGTLVFIVKKEK